MDGQLSAISNIVVLMLENRSFDHMLGFLYADSGNVAPTGQAFEGLKGTESNSDGPADDRRGRAGSTSLTSPHRTWTSAQGAKCFCRT